MHRHDPQTLIAVLDEHHIASLLMQAGKQVLLPLFAQQDFDRHHKADASLVTEADTRCQQWLQQQLQMHSSSVLAHHTIAFMGEEMSQREQQACLQQDSYWCLDPLDGTGNFAGNIPLFSISLALIHHGTPIMAWVYDPSRDELFSACQGGGLKINGCRIQPTPAATALTEAIGFIDFKRLPKDMAGRWVTSGLYRSQRNLGSCALEWAWLAAGRGDFIIHGGQKLWDYAAGLLLCEEAACVVSNLQGEHPFATPTLSSSIAAASSKVLHQAITCTLNEFRTHQSLI
jgi:myo-inositol-1(or 4)-monophosphatase